MYKEGQTSVPMPMESFKFVSASTVEPGEQLRAFYFRLLTTSTQTLDLFLGVSPANQSTQYRYVKYLL